MTFEGLYQEPSLGHLVALVRYYLHVMEVVSKEEVSNEKFNGDGASDKRPELAPSTRYLAV